MRTVLKRCALALLLLAGLAAAACGRAEGHRMAPRTVDGLLAAWCLVNDAGAIIQQDGAIASVTRTGLGAYTVTLSGGGVDVATRHVEASIRGVQTNWAAIRVADVLDATEPLLVSATLLDVRTFGFSVGDQPLPGDFAFDLAVWRTRGGVIGATGVGF